MHGHQKETVPTTHSFKKILDLACFDQATMTEEIVDPGCNVTMRTKKALHEPVYHLCETAKNVDIKWFALTETYHIVKASVSVLMEDDDLPVLPCVIRNSKYCAERPNCMASMEQTEMLSALTSIITLPGMRCCTRPKMQLHSAWPGIQRRRAWATELHSRFRSNWC